MKAFLALLFIAALAQISFGASLQPVKRETVDAFKVFKDLVADQVTMVAAVLKEVPDTKEYSKYKKFWVDYTETYNTKKDDVLCIVKMEYLMETFADTIANYKAPDAPAEVKAILALFNKHGLEELVENLKTKLPKMDVTDEAILTETC